MNPNPVPPDPRDTDPLWPRLRERARRRLSRTFKRLIRPFWMQRLDRLNRQANAPLLDPAGPVVSLTSYGDRLPWVHYTIESIGEGARKPSRIVLWIDDGLLRKGLPPSLQRLVGRGLEVRGTRDVGPHTKYLPQVLSHPAPDRPLITADDDVLYPRYWLASLVQAHDTTPDQIVCFRAHRIDFDPKGALKPYAQWPACQSTSPHPRNFLTGVSGVLYPVPMQNILRECGYAFEDCCPRNDDIWLTATAWRHGIPIRQIVPYGRAFYNLPGTREQGLARNNVQGGANDAQMRATFNPEELERLREA